jgi:hypothetical protein
MASWLPTPAERSRMGSNASKLALKYRLQVLTCSFSIDPSDYSDTDAIDPPFPFLYESLCLHVSLDALEALVDPRVPPGSAEFAKIAVAKDPPFLEVSLYESETRITSLTLFELDKKAHVAFVQQPRRIVFINLASGVRSPMLIHNYGNFPEEVRLIVNRSCTKY